MSKGAVIREFVAWYQHAYGDEQLRKLGDSVPQEYRALFDPDEAFVTFLASSWYPTAILHLAFDALAVHHNEGELRRMFRDSTRWVVKRSVSTVYRFLLAKVVTPELYAQAVPRMWKQLHTTGERRMRILEDGVAESIVTDWPGHHPLLCTLTIETMCAIFETMGCKDVGWSRKSCVAEGAAECRTIVTWS